ncbi:MAG TPA: cupin domain-containing protein [bacterium]|nr:cupin domain-containing protein [bacterium]HPN43892.1 cupin domain-containing protein [bacterium]
MIIRKTAVESFNFGGLEIADYTATLDEQSSFAVITVPPQASHKLSWSHRSDKYYYIVKGAINFSINNKDYILAQGDFCLVKKGDKFRYSNTGNKSCEMILVHTPNLKLEQEVYE